MRNIVFMGFLFMAFCIGVFCGDKVTKSRAYIPDWTPRIPYKQFFEEERKTNSPINTIYIKNWTMYVETVDGNFDIIPLNIKWR